MGSEYSVHPELKVQLDSISAPVRVIAGPDAKASVEVKGPEDYRKDVKVDFDARSNQLTIRDDAASSIGDVIVVQGGGGMSISASGGKMVINGKMSGQVIVNGVDISDLTNARGGGKRSSSDPAPEVTLCVPVGTAIKVVSCHDVTIEDVKGRLVGEIEDDAKLTVRGVVDTDITVKDDSRITITGGCGPLQLDVSEDSKATVRGSFGEVIADADDDAVITLTGTALRITGSATDDSRVDINGTVEQGVSVRTSDGGRATLNGDDISAGRKKKDKYVKW